jgi:hypothetical protein
MREEKFDRLAMHGSLSHAACAPNKTILVHLAAIVDQSNRSFSKK